MLYRVDNKNETKGCVVYLTDQLTGKSSPWNRFGQDC